MRDRIPRDPGRVRITPENGEAYYATMERADNPRQEGDALNKKNLLPDEVAEKLGLDPAANPVPADAFEHIAATGLRIGITVHGGTSAPSSPNEGDIWINTSTPVSGWAYAFTEPNNPTEGKVWLQASEGVGLDTLADGNITISPISARQYVGGLWVSKEAKTFVNGVWKDWITLLINGSDECVDVTGGWESLAVNIYNGSSARALNVTRGADYIEINGGTIGGYGGIYVTKNKIRCTGSTSLRVSGVISAYSDRVKIAALSSKTSSGVVAEWIAPGGNMDAESKTYTDEAVLDLPAGEYYIAFSIYSIESTIRLNKVYTANKVGGSIQPGGGSGGGEISEEVIAQAVKNYLEANPIEETDPTVPDWAKRPEKPDYTAEEVGALDASSLPAAVNTALAQAKASGEFDGEAGKSAYQYAQEMGYTGTEEEFAAKLAATDSETELVLSANLFDKSAAESGKVFYYGNSGLQQLDATHTYYQYVPLRGTGVYRTKWDNSQHEYTGANVVICREDNTWLQTIKGTLTATDNNYAYDMEFTITQAMINNGAAKVAFDCHELEVETVMIVKDIPYPDEYIPYGYIEVSTDKGKKLDNILREKTAVFLGDSICAGTTVEGEYYNYGWAGLIGEANLMNWFNYGKNGGTITHRGSDNSCISNIADRVISEHPAADYVILEGGCNDADQMKDAGLGVISSNYATFDTSTFSGAFEALILKLVTAYPNAKIGYIIPQKMYAQNDHTANGHVHRRFFNRAVEICDKWGIPVIDLWRGSSLNPKLSNASLFYTDGQHLTLAGYQKITPMIEAWMRNLYTPGVVTGGSSGNIILTSPNGTRFVLTVSDSGTLSATAVN